jgi:predicted nucleotidyltransferase
MVTLKLIWLLKLPTGNKKIYIVLLVTIKMNKSNKISEKKERKILELEALDASLKILYWFFSYPNKEMSLTDLATQLKISKSTANRVVSDFIKRGILDKEILGKIWRIKFNINNPVNLSTKVPYHLELIYYSGIVDEIYKKIPEAKAIILFGSYRKGDDTEESDIDIAVEVLGNEEPQLIELGILENIGYRKNIKVNVYKFSRNKVDINFFSNVVNGIVLSGFLEARP